MRTGDCVCMCSKCYGGLKIRSAKFHCRNKITCNKTLNFPRYSKRGVKP